MSRALRKAVEHSKQKKETSIHLPDEGISALEDVPELCKTILVTDKIDSFIAVSVGLWFKLNMTFLSDSFSSLFD